MPLVFRRLALAFLTLSSLSSTRMLLSSNRLQAGVYHLGLLRRRLWTPDVR